MPGWLHDLRFAARTLLRSPGFTLVAVLTLAVGIGASAAVFNVVHGVMLSSLPYSEPDRVVRLLGYRRGEDVTWGTITYPNFRDLRETSRSFAALAAYDEWQPLLMLDRPTTVSGASVNADFFDVLGIKPAQGRLFLESEDLPGSAASVVVSYELWSNELGADPAAIGGSVSLSGIPYTLVGVLPPEFEDPRLGGVAFDPPQVWRVSPGYFAETSRSSRSFTAIGRLEPGMSLETARAEIDALMAGLEQQYPDDNRNRAIALRSLKADVLGSSPTGLWLLFGAVGLLLLVGCVNLANLVLVRASNRVREFGIRGTLGASRWEMVRHLLLECLLLAAAGGLAGVLVAYFATAALQDVIAAVLPRPVNVTFEWPVMVFAAGVSLLAGFAFSLLPVVEARGISALAAIKEGGNASRSVRLAARMRWLIGAQMALTVALFLTATLLARSLVNLLDVDPGLDTKDVLTLQVDALGPDYPEHQDVTALYADVLARVAAVPGVDAVGAIDILPFSGGFNGNSFILLDRPLPPDDERRNVETRSATPGFFRAAGVPLRAGRLFDDTDRLETGRVVMINESFAAQYFPGKSPMGVRMRLFGEEWEIVGVVGDVHQFGLAEAPEAEIYTPHAQNPHAWMRQDMTLFVRGAGDVMALAPAVRAAIWSAAPNVAVEKVRTLDAVLAGSFGPERFRTVLVSVFAGIALLLGALGIYGVIAWSVAQRTREVGIRMAVGARASQVVRLVVLQEMWPAIAGGVAGLVLGGLAAQALRELLFGVTPADPLTIAFSAGVLGLTAFAACWLPAWRAARVTPMAALHYE